LLLAGCGVAVVVVLVVAVAAVGLWGGGAQRYETEVFSFDYPEGWVRQAGFDGDFQTRISVLKGGSTRYGPT
jgi:hypothetical protein